MTSKNLTRYTVSFVVLLILLAVFFVMNITIGSVNIPVGDVVAAITGQQQSPIVVDIRLPRAIAVVLLGAALSISGFLLQTFFNNPIAGPFILGISSGAKLVVSLVMVFLMNVGIASSSGVLVVAAFIGAMISMGFVLLVSQKVHRMSALIICGVMIGYICSAITDFVVTFADDSNIVNLHNWSLGSFSGISWDNVYTILLVAGLALIASFLLSKPIGAFQMGETYAQNMGVNIKLFRVALILLSSLLAATVTAFAGPISFVGIAVPHLVKTMMQTSKPLVVMPGCMLGGAAFCLMCDLIARIAFAPVELSISSVTAVFGAPIVIYMMITRHKGRM